MSGPVRTPATRQHPIVVYSHDAQLFSVLTELLAGPLAAGDSTVVVATPEHLAGLDDKLGDQGLDLDELRASGRYIELDASELLSELLTDHRALDARRLVPLITRFEEAARRSGGRLKVFSELGPLLFSRGLAVAALELEEVGTHLLGLYDLDLICAYPSDPGADRHPGDRFDDVCQAHTVVLGDADEQRARSATEPVDGADVLDSLESRTAVIDRRGRILSANTTWQSFARENGYRGVAVDENYFTALTNAPNPNAGAALAGLLSVATGDEERFELEYPCDVPNEQRWFRMTATKLPGTGPTNVVVHHRDITAERLARHQLEVRAQQLDAVDVSVIATDLDGNIVAWNAAAERLHGWTAEEAMGRPAYEVTIPVEHQGEAAAAFASIIGNGGWNGELIGGHRDGRTFPANVRNHVVHDADGEPIGIIGVAIDLSDHVAKERDLARNNAWLRAITDRVGEGLCTLDANGRVAYVNPKGGELLGATNGSVIGGSFVNRLLGVRPDGSAYGPGDQLIGADFDGGVPGEATEERLLRSDGSILPIEYVATELPADDHGEPAGWVVTFRDITGRLQEQQQLRIDAHHAQWMGRIQEALDDDHFVLHAQPIVDIATGETIQHELLIRLNDPDEGLVYPGAFLPTAESYGLAPAIDRWVIGQAIDLAAAGHPVEVNLSARSFADPTLPYLIEQLIEDTGANPASLVFELTETALLENDEAATRFAQRIHALGCQLALDDFGTGYGAFTYLKHLPVDMLKIDIEFVRDAVTEPASRHVISAVVSLARSFDMLTVAEGVEDQATFDLLAELGVDQAQGYHLARPAPLESVFVQEERTPA